MSKNVYEMVTDRIISELEKGIIPWEKPWTGNTSGAFNRVSKKPYSLLNQMLLKHSGEYATFKQWTDLGGKVRKGEKSEMVVFWKILETEEENQNGELEKKTIPLLRYISVFHISQVDGVKPLSRPLREIESIPDAETIFTDYIQRERIHFEQTASDKAFYRPYADMIHLPLRNQFKNSAEYYSTAFHEATHSTGHPNRLNRLYEGRVAAFGNEEYSKEELVAEIGSATLLNTLGIETPTSFRNNAAYIQSWLQVLKNDVKFIVSASTKAEKAVNMILVTD